MKGPSSKKGAIAAAVVVAALLTAYWGGYACLRSRGFLVLQPPGRWALSGYHVLPTRGTVYVTGSVYMTVAGHTVEPSRTPQSPQDKAVAALYLPARRAEEAFWWVRGRLTGQYPETFLVGKHTDVYTPLEETDCVYLQPQWESIAPLDSALERETARDPHSPNTLKGGNGSPG